MKKEKSKQTEQTNKNEVCTPHQRCTFYAIGKSENELLALDELDSKGDGNYFTDDIYLCRRYNRDEAFILALQKHPVFKEEYFIINYNTVRQYVRYVQEWNWGNHLYFIRETLDEGYTSKKLRPEIQKILNKCVRPMEVTKNKDGSFDVSCAATCKDTIYHLDVNVDKTGALTILRAETLAEDVYEIDNSNW